MSQWIDRVRNHGVWSAMSGFGPLLDQAESRGDLEPSALEALARLRLVLTVVGKRLAGAEPSLVYPGALDTISNGISAATGEVAAFVGNGSVGHLANANAHIDSVLGGLGQIAIPTSSEDFAGAQQAAESYYRHIEKAFDRTKSSTAAMTAEVEAVRAGLVQLSGDITVERQRLSAVVSEHQAQFSAAQESRMNEAVARQNEQQGRFASALAEYTQALSIRTAEYVALFESVRKEHAERLASLTVDFVTKAQGLKSDIEARKKEVEELVGIVGNTAVTSGYATSAQRAHTSARIWSAIAVATMIGFIGVALFEFIPAVGASFSWSALTGRVFVSLTVGVLAAYCGKQAARYQCAFRRNEKMALELAAIGPFLAPLPTEKQHEFRLAIGDRSFGREEASEGANENSSTLMELANAKGLRELIVEIVKAAKT